MPSTLDVDALTAVCDALLPSLSHDPGLGDPAGTDDYYRLGAIERGIPEQIAAAVPSLAVRVRTAIGALLADVAEEQLAALDGAERLTALRALSRRGALHRTAYKQLRAMTLAAFIGQVPDGATTNPTWPVVGYPEPPQRRFDQANAPARIDLFEPDTAELSADVVVIGSGAGGAVIAARAAAAGRSVLILEAGQHRTEAEFDQIDAHAASMFLRNGSMWSDSAQIGVLAGSVLGGGTLINSMVCLRTPNPIREQWAADGLDGLDGPDFDKYLDTVWDALNVNTVATAYNANTRAMITGLAGLGYRHERLPRNASFADDPARCGLCNAGCAIGCKRSTLHTYLQDAVAHGARIVVSCHVDRVLTSDGRAAGVAARIHGLDGERELTVHAPVVVVAAGGIESPALLLRSGIGGASVGKNLRLHPAWIVTGVYDQPIQSWAGQIQSAVSFDLTHCVDGNGFLVESLALNPMTWAGQTGFTDARAHRDALRELPYFATWHGVAHDNGSGEVYLDSDGRAAVRWDLDDANDQQVALRAHVELARMHVEAGAREVFTFHDEARRWRRGEELGSYLDELSAVPFEDYTAFSAHQMGACRLGDNPATSVADGRGELHDVRGVWIGDGSALPGAPGVNPMITIMALAERTAVALLES